MCWRFQFRTLLGMFPIVLVTAVVIHIQMFTAYTDAGGLTFAMEILNSMPHTCR